VYPAIFSGFSIFDCPFVLCTLPFSLDCPSLIASSSCVPCHFLGANKDGQSRENGRVHKTKGQTKMDNPEKMAGYTRRRGNQRWTIQRKWQGTQDEGAIKDG
jgi:hypothetical protein